jgi:hypothetical protein
MTVHLGLKPGSRVHVYSHHFNYNLFNAQTSLKYFVHHHYGFQRLANRELKDSICIVTLTNELQQRLELGVPDWKGGGITFHPPIYFLELFFSNVTKKDIMSRR